VGRPVWPLKDPPFEISAALARTYGAPVSHVPAPAIVESKEIAAALLRDPLVSSVLDNAAAADLTVVAVGHVDAATSSLVVSEAVGAEVVRSMAAAGAVAEIIGHYFDAEGRAVTNELDRRIVGLSLDALKASRQVVGVAAGSDKVAAIAAAARGALIRSLVTDRETAQALLEVSRS
jgi:DNA-binding transcriptional regulator LsrR (DeoR family)